MKAVVLGAGLQGFACAVDLARSPEVSLVVVADQSKIALENIGSRIPGSKIMTQEMDINDWEAVTTLMRQGDVTISAVPYFFNEMLTRAAIESCCHFVDMGGNTDLVLKQMLYSDQAKQAGITVIPDMGLAPGYANLLAAELIDKFDQVDSVTIRVGGLPQNSKPPLDYQLFFSVEGLINEYIGDCQVLRSGKRMRIKSLTEVEILEFPSPVGRCEAFNTLGGSSTLPLTYEGRIQNLDYKTVRYPGHCNKIQLLESLGFFEENPVKTREGMMVSPRHVTASLLTKKLFDEFAKDYVVARVTVQGKKSNDIMTDSFEFLDAYDESLQMTAMMRTTAFPVSIVAQLLGSGKILQKGVFPPEQIVPHGVVREEMAKRGIDTRYTSNLLTLTC